MSMFQFLYKTVCLFVFIIYSITVAFILRSNMVAFMTLAIEITNYEVDSNILQLLALLLYYIYGTIYYQFIIFGQNNLL